ncbi:MAG: TetR/AcrR family transcriptional regulator [Hyphomonas oceanitis]|uniref:TetR family transcriptional regulator n=1 Tax=Hyphomonas oceanitis SCH89 TaxID=1280953 RepID=A0A059G2R9_9PROT|nr:TetR/AcrR family transcriptional regulator [Hyphomonas oceanitis]KDA01014.1 TetR family transcriptional regulator [Hyphomonas oceanitis SCH89]
MGDAVIEETGKREQAKAERRSRIVQAARDLIRETGDTDLSMRMIAKRADVSLATPYNLFGSKRAVVLAVFEDERDFVVRFGRIKAANAIDRLFAAQELASSYFTDDPDFYQTIWKALLDTRGTDETGLATTERLERNSAAWRMLIEAAQAEGLINASFASEALERTLSYLANGVMLSWVMGTLETRHLRAAGALGYAIALRGVATGKGIALLDERIRTFESLLHDKTAPEAPIKQAARGA